MEKNNNISEILANDVRTQYQTLFKTIKRIAEVFPGSRWREPHGDEYYIPCRIAYHLAVDIDDMIAGSFGDNDPYGNWVEAKAEEFPDKSEFLTYFDSVIERAEKALSSLDDESLMSPLESRWAWYWTGASQMILHLYIMRELSHHIGELNKMLIENGVSDVWIAR